MPTTLKPGGFPVRRHPVRQAVEVLIDALRQIAREARRREITDLRLVERDDVQGRTGDRRGTQLREAVGERQDLDVQAELDVRMLGGELLLGGIEQRVPTVLGSDQDHPQGHGLLRHRCAGVDQNDGGDSEEQAREKVPTAHGSLLGS